MEKDKGKELKQAPSILIKEPSFKDLEPKDPSDLSGDNTPIHRRNSFQKSNFSNGSDDNNGRQEPPMTKLAVKSNNFMGSAVLDDQKSLKSKGGGNYQG